MACQFQNLLAINVNNQEKQNPSSDRGQRLMSLRSNPANDRGFYTYPLVLECPLEKASIKVAANYDQAVLSQWDVERLYRQLAHAIQQLHCFDHMSPLRDVFDTSTDDQDLIRKSTSAPHHSVEACVHELVEKLALSDPYLGPVCPRDGSMTYGELNTLFWRGSTTCYSSSDKRNYGLFPV